MQLIKFETKKIDAGHKIVLNYDIVATVLYTTVAYTCVRVGQCAAPIIIENRTLKAMNIVNGNICKRTECDVFVNMDETFARWEQLNG